MKKNKCLHFPLNVRQTYWKRKTWMIAVVKAGALEASLFWQKRPLIAEALFTASLNNGRYEPKYDDCLSPILKTNAWVLFKMHLNNLNRKKNPMVSEFNVLWAKLFFKRMARQFEMRFYFSTLRCWQFQFDSLHKLTLQHWRERITEIRIIALTYYHVHFSFHLSVVCHLESGHHSQLLLVWRTTAVSGRMWGPCPLQFSSRMKRLSCVAEHLVNPSPPSSSSPYTTWHYMELKKRKA